MDSLNSILTHSTDLMKIRKLLLILPGAFLLSGSAFAVEINWGSDVDSVLRDSMGVPLDDTFLIQLGFFQTATAEPFIPDESNVGDWAANWKVFDQAAFSPVDGYFTSTALLNSDGSSSSSFATLGIDFSGQQTYIWTYNSTNPIPGSEWFLSTDPTWVMPDAVANCCDNILPYEWSIADLDFGDPGDTPVFGKQGGQTGAGVFTNTAENYDFQTFTFIPEPSSALLILLSGVAFALRRRR
jgi:hypothetical protein